MNALKVLTTLITLIILAACSQSPSLSLNMSDKFDGRDVEVINFLDSTPLGSATIKDGHAVIRIDSPEPIFTAVLIDGRTRAFYISEPGTASVNDSINSAVGTPLNDKFLSILTRLDSIENTDDMDAYLRYVITAYNENKDNPIAQYLGMEWIKYASLSQIDSLLATAPQPLVQSPKTKYYVNFARLRDNTAPGRPYADIDGETADGLPVSLIKYVKEGEYTLVDFWASWCPYCIKELPEMAALHQDGLNIVGVAVRDVPEDTKAAIGKHNITWPVIFNTQRRPYDVYGFTGIPHHLLIGPDGTIVSRGETLRQIRTRLFPEP